MSCSSWLERCVSGDDYTDEIVVAVSDESAGMPGISHPALGTLDGLRVEYAWCLTNHCGYVDAFQLRLVDGRGREETRQLEVAASAMDVRRVG